MSEYDDLKKKAKSFGINIGAIEEEIDRRIQAAIDKSYQLLEAKFTELFKDNISSKLPSLEDVVAAVQSRIPAASVDIESITKEIAARLPNTGAVEEARIAKQVQDAALPVLQKYLVEVMDQFKARVAEELKAIRENNEKLIQQSIVSYKDGITQEVNKRLDAMLHDISEKIESSAGRESKVDKYLPFLEKLVGNERPPADPFDVAISQAEKYQRLIAIFGGQHQGPDPNVVYNNQSRALIEGMKLIARARDINRGPGSAGAGYGTIRPKFSGPSKGPLTKPAGRISGPNIDPIVAGL